jgi:hypothetical protein
MTDVISDPLRCCPGCCPDPVEVLFVPGLGSGACSGSGDGGLRKQLAQAIAWSNRAVSDVAAEPGMSWRTAHQAPVAAAARWLPEPEPTSRLGIDETRFGSVRWILDGITWKRSDPWLTSFVDCSGDAGSMLGLAPWPHWWCAGLVGRTDQGV